MHCKTTVGDINPMDLISALFVAHIQSPPSFTGPGQNPAISSSTSHGLNFASVQNFYLIWLFWLSASETAPGGLGRHIGHDTSPQGGLECDH